MAAWGFLGFGLLSLIIGIILVIIAAVWRLRNTVPSWTGGQLAALSIGIILIVLGIVLLFLSWAYWTPTVLSAVIVPPPAPLPAPIVSPVTREFHRKAQEEASIVSENFYLIAPIIDPETGGRTTVAGLRRKCSAMDVNQLQDLSNQYDDYRISCSDILRKKRYEAGLPL